MIFPLLWIIYYDPLFCHIKNLQHKYSTSVNHLMSIDLLQYEQLKVKCNLLDYLDNTIWITSSKKELEDMLSWLLHPLHVIYPTIYNLFQKISWITCLIQTVLIHLTLLENGSLYGTQPLTQWLWVAFIRNILLLILLNNIISNGSILILLHPLLIPHLLS